MTWPQTGRTGDQVGLFLLEGCQAGPRASPGLWLLPTCVGHKVQNAEAGVSVVWVHLSVVSRATGQVVR